MQNKFKELIKLYDETVESSPQEALVYSEKGVFAAKNVNDETALYDFVLKKANAQFRLKLYDSAIKTYKYALKYYQSVDSVYQTYFTLRRLGNTYSHKVNRDSSLYFYLLAQDFAVRLDDRPLLAKNQNAIGLDHWYLGHYSEALSYFQSAIKNINTIKDSGFLGLIYNNIGAVYWGLSMYDLAMEYYQKSLSIRELLNQKRQSVIILNNIGMVLNATHKPEDAFKYYSRAMDICLKEEYLTGRAYTQVNLANYYRDKKQFAKAQGYLDQAAINYGESGQKHYIGYINQERGDLFLAKKDYKKAIDYYEKALTSGIQDNFKNGMAKAYSSLGNVYLKMDAYEKCILFANKSIEISSIENYRDLLRDDYLNISKAYDKLGRYKSALVYYMKSEEIKDSIFEDQKLFKLNEIQVRYETDKKEKENAILRTQGELQRLELEREAQIRYFLIFIAVLVVVILALIYWRYALQKQVSLSLRVTNSKIQKINTENEKLINELRETLAREKTLRGLLPMCSSCKKIRNDKGYWDEVDTYISHHSDVDVTHSICPDCVNELYPELSKKK